MLQHLLAILGLGVVCGLWVLLQRWVAVRMPEAPGIDRSCSGCARDGTCRRSGARCEEASR